MNKERLREELSGVRSDAKEIELMLDRCSEAGSVDKECQEISKMLDRL